MEPCESTTRSAGENAVSSTAPKGTRLDPERWVERHADPLFRYARSKVASPDVAEDLVQDTLLAAWKSAPRFEGRASERTWLMRILRNKITDFYRKQRPEIGVDNLSELAQLEEKQFIQSGYHAGCWSVSGRPGPWKHAEQAVDRAEFWKVLHRCAQKLPPHTATAFLMRSVDDQSTEEICSTLKINRNHLGVLLHRARLAIRRCLELNWFREQS